MRLVVLTTLALLSACRGVVVTAFPDKFVGVGLELTVRDNIPTVVRAIDGGSAQEAGLRSEDRLVEINGEPVAGMSLPEIVLRLRGQSGSTVVVRVARGGEQMLASLVRHDIQRTGEDYVARH